MEKRGVTLTELLIVVAILGILAGIATPMFTRYVRRSEFKEAGTVAKLVASAANYYDAKYGIATLASVALAGRWDALSIDEPQNTKCEYLIVNATPIGGLGLRVNSPPGGNWLFAYRFTDQRCRINAGNTDSQFIFYRDMPGQEI